MEYVLLTRGHGVYYEERGLTINKKGSLISESGEKHYIGASVRDPVWGLRFRVRFEDLGFRVGI